MIGPARWLPLSLAVHAAALGGGVWLAREVGERPLFVDLTLRETESDGGEPAVGAPGEGARPAPRRALAASSSGSGSDGSVAPAASLAPPPPAATPPSAPSSPSAVTPPPAASPLPAPSAPPAATPPPAPPPVVAPLPVPAPAVSAPPTTPPSPVAAAGPPERAAESSAPPGGARGATAAAGVGGGGGGGGAGGRGIGREGGGAAASGRGDGEGALALAVPGDGGGGAYGPYLEALRRRLQETLEYPAAARRRGLAGTVHLDIALDATGRVREVVLARSSSHALLDDAALEAARGLARVPFPPDVRPRALRVRLPVVFELR
jgi:TonB family protein